jgi:predicted nucleic acid-binding protein
VLDTGPLVALFDATDGYHAQAEAGFYELQDLGTRLIAPLPIVFEVYKWLLQQRGVGVARAALEEMRDSLKFAFVDEADMNAAERVLASMPGWRGTLEDALVASMAVEIGVPLWTMNYRDFGTFPKLTFWTPG